jgi:hypothetical protein
MNNHMALIYKIHSYMIKLQKFNRLFIAFWNNQKSID